MNHDHLRAWTMHTDSSKPLLSKLTPLDAADMIPRPYYSLPSAEANMSPDVTWLRSTR